MKFLALAALSLAISSIAQANEDPSVACLLSVEAKPDLYPLSKKVALITPKEQTFDMLTNTTKASKADKKLISIWVKAVEDCLALGEEHRKRAQPAEVLAMIETSKTDFLTLTAELYSSKITYGEYAAARAQKLAEFEKNLQDYISKQKERQAMVDAAKAAQTQRERELAMAEEHRRQAIAQQEEQARRQAALGILLNMKPSVPMQIQPYQMPTGTNTHCTMYGNQMNCSTR